MIKVSDIINEAYSWVDTPFHHQGRMKGVAVDCAGVVVGVAKALGIEHWDRNNYPREPFEGLLESVVQEQLIITPEPEPGCVLLMKFNRHPQHLAILTDKGTIIHAYSNVGKTVEHRFNDIWKKRVVKIFKFPGVDY